MHGPLLLVIIGALLSFTYVLHGPLAQHAPAVLGLALMALGGIGLLRQWQTDPARARHAVTRGDDAYFARVDAVAKELEAGGVTYDPERFSRFTAALDDAGERPADK